MFINFNNLPSSYFIQIYHKIHNMHLLYQNFKMQYPSLLSWMGLKSFTAVLQHMEPWFPHVTNKLFLWDALL